MIAGQTPKQTFTQPKKKNYFLRWTLIISGAVLGLILSGVVFVGVWAVHALHRFELLRKDARSAYEALNADFPFSVPSSTAEIPVERFESYLRAHRELLRSISPLDEELARAILQTPSIGGFRLLRIMRQSYPFLKSASLAHERALRSEKMSLNEYLWIHGLIMRDTLTEESGDFARSTALRKILDQLQNVSESEKGRRRRFDAETFIADLRDRYQKYNPAPKSILDEFTETKTLGALIDLFAANRSMMDDLIIGGNETR